MFQFEFYGIYLVICFASSVFLAVVLWRKKFIPDYKVGTLLFLSYSIWSLAYSLEVISTSFELKILFNKFEYIGIILIPVTFFFIVLRYCGYESWITAKRILLLSIIPFITLILVFTNDFHGLIWSNSEIHYVDSIAVLKNSYGPWFWTWSIVAYGLLGASYIVLIRQLINKFKVFRLQAAIMVAVISIPLITNILFISRLFNYKDFDFTPLALMLSSAIFIYGISNKGLGDIIPIRYESVVESISDNVLILDKTGRILFVNKNCGALFKKKGAELIGKNVIDVFPEFRNFSILKKVLNFNNLILFEALKEKFKDFEVTISDYIDKRQRMLGNVIILRDISEKLIAQSMILKSEQKFRNIFSKSPIGISLYDENFKLVDANDAAIEIFGVADFEQIRNMVFYSRVIGEDNLENLKRGKTISYETEFDFDRVRKNKIYNTYKSGKIFMDIMISQILIGDEEGKKQGYLVHFQDITERKASEENIKYLSFHDKLTGVYNRAYLEEELARLDNERQLPISFIIGDVNGLKLINDSFGHLKGDKLLIKIASLIKQICRREDIVARWGGDEFAILLPKTPEDISQKILKRIQTKCLKHNQEDFPLSIALGFATKTDVNTDMRKIIIEAEDRMYKRKMLESKSISSSIISSLKSTLWEKSHETEEHAMRMTALSVRLGKSINLQQNELDDLILLATLHDIGKIGISEEILTKIGSLDESEWNLIKKHPEIGYRISKSTPQLFSIAEYVLAHHESWNGLGYPKGLKGEEIPLLSRIVSLVDAYDVIINGRPYKKALNLKEAIKEIKRCSGTQFDPYLVDKFIEIISNEEDKDIIEEIAATSLY